MKPRVAPAARSPKDEMISPMKPRVNTLRLRPKKLRILPFDAIPFISLHEYSHPIFDVRMGESSDVVFWFPLRQ